MIQVDLTYRCPFCGEMKGTVNLCCVWVFSEGGCPSCYGEIVESSERLLAQAFPEGLPA